MITALFRRAGWSARLMQSPAAEHLDALVLRMQKQGYASATIMSCVLSAEKFCQWLFKERLPLADVDETLVARYTNSLPRRIREGCPKGIPHKHAGGLFHLVEVLREAHVVASLRPVTPATGADRWHATRTISIAGWARRGPRAVSVCTMCVDWLNFAFLTPIRTGPSLALPTSSVSWQDRRVTGRALRRPPPVPFAAYCAS